MINYLTTEIPAQIVEPIIKYYLNLNKRSVFISDKLNKYLIETFEIDLPEILNKLVNNIRVSQIEKSLLSIYILNESIGEHTLESILQLIEFGNRDFPPTNQITKLLSTSISQTENRLGGA